MELKVLLLLVLAIVSCVHSQSLTYVLNNTAYQSYYDQFCLTEPHSASCAPFSTASLWIPEGVPDANSTVIINSPTSTLTLIVAPTLTVTLSKLSLNGSVSLVVEGDLQFYVSQHRYQPPFNYTLVVCDDSVVSVVKNGGLISYTTAFYDQSSLVVNGTGTSQMNYVLASGTDVSFKFAGGNALFGTVTGTVQTITASNFAYVYGPVINASSLVVTDSPMLLIFVNIMAQGELTGTNYSINGVAAFYNSNLILNGCANITYFGALMSSNVTLYTGNAPCNLAKVAVEGQGRVNIIGNQNVAIGTLYQNQMPGDQGVISFVQTSSGQTTLIALPSTTRNGYLEFIGNFNVTAGVIDKWGLGQYRLTSIVVNGQVNFIVVSLQLADMFQFTPGFNIYLPSNATLEFSNTTFSLETASIDWSPYATVWLDTNAVVTAQEYVLTAGRRIIISSEQPSLLVANLTIDTGSVLIARQPTTSIVGNVTVAGELMLDTPFRTVNLTINGNLIVRDTGVVTLPQMMDYYWLDPATSISSFIGVQGSAYLGGILNITLGGQFPANTTAKNYSVSDIPVLQAANISNDFASFKGAISHDLAYLADNQIALSYKIANNTVYLHLERPVSKNSDRKLYYIIGGAVAGGVLLIILVVVLVARRRTGYTKL